MVIQSRLTMSTFLTSGAMFFLKVTPGHSVGMKESIWRYIPIVFFVLFFVVVVFLPGGGGGG